MAVRAIFAPAVLSFWTFAHAALASMASTGTNAFTCLTWGHHLPARQVLCRDAQAYRGVA